jgi:hypothetical protein
MKPDKVLERMALENRKKVLETVKKKAIKHELYIDTPRGTYKLPMRVLIDIMDNTNEEILLIDKKLEELTGLNQDRMEELYLI